MRLLTLIHKLITMAVRLKEWMIPYTWGVGIEITNNHIINVLLREANNLIHVNENNELYVDLQLEDGIEPTDDFPVWVTTGRILEEDWRPMNGLILNWKTTSWDYARLIIWSDNNVYIDIGDGNWILLGEGSSILNCNTRTFYLENISDLTTAQEVYDWYKSWKNAIIFLERWAPYDPIYILHKDWGTELEYGSKIRFTRYDDRGYTDIAYPRLRLMVTDDVVTEIALAWENHGFLDTNGLYSVSYTPTQPYHPAPKKYVDDWLALKQDILTAWTRITIDANNVISADVSSIFIFMGTVATVNDLPANPNVGDTYLVSANGHLYAWDGTQWNDLWNTTLDLTNYFNKVTDDSDDIIEGSNHLFVDSTEKAYWNWKQNALTAWTWINIDLSNVISATPYTAWNAISISGFQITNTKPFDPENSWTLSQILKKTSTGYRWADETIWVTSVNWRTWAVTVDEFQPWSWTTWQILRKTANGYEWSDESWWGGGWGHTYYEGTWIDITNYVISNEWVLSVNNQTWAVTVNEVPTGGTTGQVLTKTANGYWWMSAMTSANVKQWVINSNTVTTATLQDIHTWVTADANNWAIIWDSYTNDVFLYHHTTTGSWQTNLIFYGVKRSSEKHTSNDWDYTVAWQLKMAITYNGSTYSCVTMRNTDDATVTNYLSVAWSGYTTPFIPTADYQPTTKKYVDSKEWHGTQAQYNALPSTKLTDWVVYNILPS